MIIIMDFEQAILLLFQETISTIKQQVTLAGFDESMWIDEHSETILKFIRCAEENKRLLTFHINAQKELIVSTDIPVNPIDQVFFMIRKKETKITTTNFHQTVLFQLVRSNFVESLLRMMSSVYGPMFFQNKSWPESILFFIHFMYIIFRINTSPVVHLCNRTFF